MLTADDVRAILRDELPRKRSDRPDSRNKSIVHCQLTKDEYAAVRDAADARGWCMADLVRLGLETVIGRPFPRNRVVPINLIEHNRERQEKALRETVRQGIIARRMLRDTGAAVSQTATVPVPKLRGPQRPE